MIRFDDRFLDEIKSRLRLSDVIGRTVKLRRQGREYAGLSPFTKEKTPSFFVNDEKGFYHCFSSGKHGDLISFLQETERLSFTEAVERLAGEAGLALPEQDPRAAEQDRKRASLQDWLEAAAAWFEGELRRPSGQAARAYLHKRGLPEADWKRFRIGYAPAGRTALKDHLVQKGARPAELIEAGLLIAPEDGGAPYDRFRDRIIFPIADARGRTISFGGRALDPEARAKYLNGPETELFNKSRVLYGYPEARRLLGTGEADAPLVVVEGYMDVIACQRAGVAAVAGMGTALTEEQMALMWRLHPEPTLCLDGDNAGRRAAARAIDRALPLLQPGRSFRFALVSGGKDPDDVLREQGPAALKAQLSQTTPFVEALFVRERDLAPYDTPERKIALKARLRACAATIADKELSAAYKDDLLGRYEALWPTEAPVYTVGAAARAMAKHRWVNKKRKITDIPAVSDLTPEGKQAAERLRRASNPFPAALLVAAINHPIVTENKIESLDSQGLGNNFLNRIVKEILHIRMGSEFIDAQFLIKMLIDRGYSEDILFIESMAKLASAPFLSKDIGEANVKLLWEQAYDLIVRLITLERALEQAKEDFERDRDFETVRRLKAMRDAVDRGIRSGNYQTSAAVH